MRRWALVLVGAVAALALVEVYSSFVWREFVRGHKPSLTPYPVNSTLSFDFFNESFSARTNEWGYFDPPLKPRLGRKGRRRIAVVGDSMTQGFGVPPSEAFPELLRQQLAGKAEVLQFAYIGAGPGHLACVLERLAQETTLEEVVFVTYLPNDFKDALYEQGLPCFWWQRAFAARPSFPVSLHLLRHLAAPAMVRVRKLPSVRWTRVALNSLRFLRRSFTEDGIGSWPKALASFAKAAVSEERFGVARVLSTDRFHELPFEIQKKIVDRSIYSYTVLSAFAYPHSFQESSLPEDERTARAYYAHMLRALSSAYRASARRFTIVTLVQPGEYDPRGMALLSQLGFAAQGTMARENLRVRELRRWTESNSAFHSLTLRIADPTSALRDGAREGTLLTPWDTHFNRTGHRLLAQWLARQLQ